MSKKIEDGMTAKTRYQKTKRKNLTFGLGVEEYHLFKNFADENGLSLQTIFRETIYKMIEEKNKKN